jgi:hypothetical protein
VPSPAPRSCSTRKPSNRSARITSTRSGRERGQQLAAPQQVFVGRYVRRRGVDDPGWKPVIASGLRAPMAGTASSDKLAEPFAALTSFAEPGMLTLRIGDLERQLARRTREQAMDGSRSSP